MSNLAIKVENLRKQYRLGTIGGGTLSADLESWWARKRGKEDPNTLIGTDQTKIGEYFWALDGINFEIEKGEAVGIIGSNGAGKSTLLKILSRVTSPTEGKIGINGRVTSMLEVGTGFHPELTGRENIYMNGAILGMTKAEIDTKIEQIIDFSECRQFIDTPVKRYSSGMYVKLAFAVAAHLDSEIMIMDEVLAVGDVKFQQKCLGKMGNAAQNDGKTVLYVSHNMSTIKQLCDRCIVLNHGKMIFDGNVEDAIQIYIGEEENNLTQFYDLRESERSSHQPGTKVRLQSIEFWGKEMPIYSPEEKVNMRLKWEGYEDLGEIHFYFILRYIDGTTVGMVESETIGEVVAGEEGEAIVQFDISNLADGVYYFIPDLYTINEQYQHQSYDHPLDKIYFKIVSQNNRKGIYWQRQYFGSVSLNRMKLLRDEN
ncbi:MAG: ABC transporter ATP-binding protein [Agathobacter sp.]